MTSFGPAGGDTGDGQQAVDDLILGLTDQQIPKFDSSGNKLVDSAIFESAQEIGFTKKLNIPTSSITFGETMQLSEGISDLVVINLLKKQMAFTISADFTHTTGSDDPSYINFGPQFTLDVNLDDTQNITTNPLNFQITGTSVAPNVRLIHTLTLRAGSPMINFRAKITANATGIVLRHIPSKFAYEGGTPGLDLIAGDNVFFAAGDDPSTPGVFNLGYIPFILEPGQLVDLEFIADNMDLLGTAADFPYLTANVHDGPPTVIGVSTQTSIPNLIKVDLAAAKAGTYVIGELVSIKELGLHVVVTSSEITDDNGIIEITGQPTLRLAKEGAPLTRKALHLKSGWISGGLLAKTIPNSANFDMTTDLTVRRIDHELGTVTYYVIPASTNNPTGLIAGDEKYFGIEIIAGLPTIKSFTNVEFEKNNIFMQFGRIWMDNAGLVSGLLNYVDIAYGCTASDVDEYRSSSQVKPGTGGAFALHATLKTLTKVTDSKDWRYGAWAIDTPNNPHSGIDPFIPQIDTWFIARHSTIIFLVEPAIPTDQYEDAAGVLTVIPNNKWVVMPLFHWPKSNAQSLQYPQDTFFSSMDDAEDNFNFAQFEVSPALQNTTICKGWIIYKKDAAVGDWGDPLLVKFIPQNFVATTGGGGGGGGGASIPVIDNLLSTDPNSALSANQGRVLNEKIAPNIANTNLVLDGTRILDLNANQLTLGDGANAVLNLNPALQAALFFGTSGGIRLNAGGIELVIGGTDDLQINGSVGVVGQALITQGNNNPPVWDFAWNVANRNLTSTGNRIWELAGFWISIASGANEMLRLDPGNDATLGYDDALFRANPGGLKMIFGVGDDFTIEGPVGYLSPGNDGDVFTSKGNAQHPRWEPPAGGALASDSYVSLSSNSDTPFFQVIIVEHTSGFPGAYRVLQLSQTNIQTVIDPSGMIQANNTCIIAVAGVYDIHWSVSDDIGTQTYLHIRINGIIIASGHSGSDTGAAGMVTKLITPLAIGDVVEFATSATASSTDFKRPNCTINQVR